MKKITILFFLIYPFFLFSQLHSSDSMESLKNLTHELNNQITSLRDSISKINDLISELKAKEYLLKYENNDSLLFIKTVTTMEAKLRRNSDPSSTILERIPGGDTITILDFFDNYWGVRHDSVYGYLHSVYLVNTDEMETIIYLHRQEIERINQAALESDKKEKELLQKEFKDMLYNKFGSEVAKRLLKNQYWIGMTDEMALISLGSPDKKNRSVGSWGIHEQWIYGDTYLYFENGVLNSYQNY